MIPLLHIITALDTGGAETMLLRLLSATDRSRFAPRVAALAADGPVGAKIRALGIPVEALGMRRGVPDPLGFLRLVRSLRRERPELIQTWMYHADLLGGLAAPLAGGIPVVWGIHHSNLDPAANKQTTLWTVRLNARLSGRLPRRIVCCSESARATHAAIGYRADRMVVIPNGFDLGELHPDPAMRAWLRAECRFPADCRVAGMVARYHPQKDHANFLEAARLAARDRPDVRFVLCGAGVDADNAELARAVDAAGLRNRIVLLGPRGDVPRILAGLDVAVSASRGEAFPLAVGEAMACGTPCAVTEVGDSADMVGDTGRTAPPRDPAALAAALGAVLDLPPEERRRLGAAARRRVAECYSLDRAAAAYAKLYGQVLAETRRGAASPPPAPDPRAQ